MTTHPFRDLQVSMRAQSRFLFPAKKVGSKRSNCCNIYIMASNGTRLLTNVSYYRLLTQLCRFRSDWLRVELDRIFFSHSDVDYKYRVAGVAFHEPNIL